MPSPDLPPAYDLVRLEPEIGAFERAVRAAPRGLDDGTIYWSERADRLDMAVVLEPDAPAATVLQAVYVLTVATGDALEVLLPPVAPVAFAWPSHILLDDASLGRVRVALAPVAAPDDAPPWLVLGVGLVCPVAQEVTVPRLLQCTARQFLRWTGRWLDDGLAPVRDAWNRRCHRRGDMGEVVLGERHIQGRVRGLATDGSFVIGAERLPLAAHLQALA